MPATDETSPSATIQSLNWIFWIASIGLFLSIVIRSEIWPADVTSNIFWINFAIFLAAGLGTAATTHFAASALPLLLGVMTLAADHAKASWFWLNLYVFAAALIGFFAGITKLTAYLNSRG